MNRMALLLFLLLQLRTQAQQTELGRIGIALIPYPKEVRFRGENFVFDRPVTLVMDQQASPADRFAAGELLNYLTATLRLKAVIGQASSGSRSIYLTRKGTDEEKLQSEGYSLTVRDDRIVIRASGEAGLFYGVQTIRQLIQKQGGTTAVRGMEVVDWPDTKVRAAHYDTKHHQDTREFVQQFIRDLSEYKINMLIWEWEDKFEYPSHPEIGAPGAFTLKEMQALTRYAQQYHIQIVPLVQGLGHASFILKWPQFAGLREIPASNFEFCPLKEGSYKLLSDLWRDAIEATPGSKYIHIGSDEAYELGKCPECQNKERELGKSGLYHLFVSRSAKPLQQAGRQVMVWESPMGWAEGRLKVYHNDMKQDQPVTPQKGIILTESYDYETADLKYAKKARALGYPVYAYDPNPGIEQLFLPYFFSKGAKDSIQPSSLKNSYDFLQSTMGKEVFDGVTRTSWDDAGLPMQDWMLCFATTAAFSWNAAAPSLREFTTTFFRNRYGSEATGIDTLYHLLNEGAYFYMESFERKVWAWGEIGKTRLPDLPRGDAVEYDPFWNTEYAGRVRTAKEFLEKMDRAMTICRQNLDRDIQNRYDIEVFNTLAGLVRHTALTYLDLSRLEQSIGKASENRFVNIDTTLAYLEKAVQIVKDQLARREMVFEHLVRIWQQTRLPKGMSVPGKNYFFEQDRTRHFANRAPDMTYLIIDERKLGLENYLLQLQQYIHSFRQRFSPGSNTDPSNNK